MEIPDRNNFLRVLWLMVDKQETLRAELAMTSSLGWQSWQDVKAHFPLWKSRGRYQSRQTLL